MLELETLLAPVTVGEPSGSLLEYDPGFLALVELAKGKPEQRMGEAVIPAEPPNWSAVENAAVALLARTKDLRVATLLAKARLHVAGAPGLFDGIAFVRRLLETHWDTIHPQLDAEEGNDPAMRVFALAELCDPETVLAPLRDAEVASARGIGRIRVRDLERAVAGVAGAPAAGAAAGSAEAPTGEGKAPPVDLVLAKCERDPAVRLAEGAAAAVADLRRIEALVAERSGGARAPDLSRLTAILQLVAKTLTARLGLRGDRPPEPVAEPAAAGTDARAGNASGGGAIASREDVLLALDRICAYYERSEPSSPIPLLLKRSRRLVAMSFIEIVRDVAPDAVPIVEALRGKEE
jgi:type VI secretion system protein ImpA